jgi:hypothetical protein
VLILSRIDSSILPNFNCQYSMVPKKDTALLAISFAKVANNQKYWNQWLVADVWATVINQELQLPDDLKVTGSYLSMWLLRTIKYRSISACVDIYHVPNVFGLFRSKIAKVTAFYVTSTSLSPKLNHHMPGGSTQFVRDIVATIQTRAETERNNRTTTTNLPSTTRHHHNLWWQKKRNNKNAVRERKLGGG